MLFDVFMIMVLIAIFYVSWLMACAIVPQSQIDAVERIGKWAKTELDKIGNNKSVNLFRVV